MPVCRHSIACAVGRLASFLRLLPRAGLWRSVSSVTLKAHMQCPLSSVAPAQCCPADSPTLIMLMPTMATPADLLFFPLGSSMLDRTANRRRFLLLSLYIALHEASYKSVFLGDSYTMITMLLPDWQSTSLALTSKTYPTEVSCHSRRHQRRNTACHARPLCGG